MDVVRPSEIETLDMTDQAIFEGGGVWQLPLAGAIAKRGDQINVINVQFAPGARTVVHSHSSDQVLYVSAGIGKVGDADGEHVIGVGDAVGIPADSRHWHGAADTGSPFAHLSITKADSQTTLYDD